MKKLTYIVTGALMLMWGSIAGAQDMPAGNVVRTLNCSLKDGVTMDNAVAWARGNPRGENAPVALFFREAIHTNPNFRANYDFQIAFYFPSYSAYVANLEEGRSDSPRVRGQRRPQDLMTCNPATSVLSSSRQVPGTDNFAGDESLMTTRFCRLEEGRNVQDAFEFASTVAENFRRAGNNSLMQVNTRQYGAVPDRTGNAVVIASVGATPADIGARADLTREGMSATAGADNPFTLCNFPNLWRTHAIFRAQN